MTETIIIFAVITTFLFVAHWVYSQHITGYIYRRRALPWLNTQFKKDCYDLFTRLYQGQNTYRFARAAKHEFGLDKEDSFTYGEIDFLYFGMLLEKVNPQPGEIFADLGSGAGKAVFTTALLYPGIKAVGVEILPGLYHFSTAMLENFKRMMDEHPRLSEQQYDIEFMNNNMLNVGLSEVSIIFINATCYDDRFLQAVSDSISDMAIGSRVIITTHPLYNDYFDLIHQEVTLMSWGLCDVKIYERVR